MSAEQFPSPADPTHPADSSDRLAELAARAERGRERVVLTRDGKPVAAVVPIEDLKALQAWEDADDSRLAAEAMAQWEAEGRPLAASLDELAGCWGVDLASEAE